MDAERRQWRLQLNSQSSFYEEALTVRVGIRVMVRSYPYPYLCTYLYPCPYLHPYLYPCLYPYL